MKWGQLYERYRRFRERADARSMAVLISTSGAIPLSAIALLSPAFIREGGTPYLIVVWVTTTAIFLITAVIGRLSDGLFSVLGLVGMAGVAVSAQLVTDPAVARGIVTLLSVVPAIAAMASSRRVILGHTIVAILLGWAVSIAIAGSVASVLVSCAVSVAVIWLPVFMIVTLRRWLDFSRARYRELANTDPLTGLPNRRGFLDQIERYSREGHSNSQGIGFLVIDVDHFKQINDHFGHAAGDEVLCDVVTAIHRSVPPEVLVGRFGGEEFMVFFTASNISKVTAHAEAVRVSVAEMSDVTVSVGGICCAVENQPDASAMTLNELIDILTRRADTLMYTAKEAGRNTIRCERLPDMRVDLLVPDQIDGTEPARFDITTPTATSSP